MIVNTKLICWFGSSSKRFHATDTESLHSQIENPGCPTDVVQYKHTGTEVFHIHLTSQHARRPCPSSVGWGRGWISRITAESPSKHTRAPAQAGLLKWAHAYPPWQPPMLTWMHIMHVQMLRAYTRTTHHLTNQGAGARLPAKALAHAPEVFVTIIHHAAPFWLIRILFCYLDRHCHCATHAWEVGNVHGCGTFFPFTRYSILHLKRRFLKHLKVWGSKLACRFSPKRGKRDVWACLWSLERASKNDTLNGIWSTYGLRHTGKSYRGYDQCSTILPYIFFFWFIRPKLILKMWKSTLPSKNTKRRNFCVFISSISLSLGPLRPRLLQSVAVCCNVLQRLSASCSLSQCVAVCCSVSGVL